MRLKKQKKGFSLVETLLVLAVIMSFFIVKIIDEKREVDKVLSKNTSEQALMVSKATNAYINLNYEDISKLNNQQGMNCNKQSQICNITIETLKNNRLLPSEFSTRSLVNSNYKIVLKRTGIAPNYSVNGLVYFDQPIRESNNSYDGVLSGLVLQNIGIDSGVAKNGVITGFGGSWKENQNTYGLNLKNGTIGINVGYSANMYSIYLRRDGSLPMTGSLNLAENNINNAKNITASSQITSDKVEVKTGNLEQLNSNTIVNKNTFRSDGATVLNGQTDINGSYFTINTNADFKKDVSINGFFGVKGETTFDGFAKFNNSILASGVTADLGNVKASGTLNVKGKTTLEDEVTMGAFNTPKVKVAGGNITADGNVQGKLLIPKTVAVLNGVCTIKGALAQDNTGGTLSCKNGRWGLQSSTTEFYVMFERRCSTPNKATGACSCSAGLTAVHVSSINDGCTSTGANGSCNSKYYNSYFCR